MIRWKKTYDLVQKVQQLSQQIEAAASEALSQAIVIHDEIDDIESQITSGKAESTIDTLEFKELLVEYGNSLKGLSKARVIAARSALIAHIEAVREKDREEAYAAGRRNGARDERSQSKSEAEEAAALAAVLPNGAAVTNVYDAYSEGLKQADRDHFKAIAERQAAEPETVAVDKTLLRAACNEIRKYAIPSGADDQVVLNLEAYLSPAQQEPAKDVWADGINPAHVAAYDTALQDAASQQVAEPVHQMASRDGQVWTDFSKTAYEDFLAGGGNRNRVRVLYRAAPLQQVEK